MTPEKASLPAGTVLVVDDEPSVRRSTARLLRRAGAEVLEAASASEALAYGRAHGLAVDVILSDVVMPEVTGIELAQQARELWPEARIILFSAFTPAALARHHLDGDSGTRILQKPLERDDLLAAVAAALRG
jgi:two-component system cell cycle sensor histidine kinase/response regulator CckA